MCVFVVCASPFLVAQIFLTGVGFMESGGEMKRVKISPLIGVDRINALKSIPQWKEVDGRDAISRQYHFENFRLAFFHFMVPVGAEAERNDHHPEWFNVYNRVEVTLATHECSGVSQRDIQLAKFMDALYASVTSGKTNV